MGASAEKFQTDVHSFKGTMDVFVGTGDKTIDLKGDMSFREPDSSYLTMDIPGAGQLEELLLPPDMYMGDGEQWIHMDLTAVSGVDFKAMEEYAQNRGPVSYSDVVKKLQQLQQLPNETIDGKSYWHYQGTLDSAKALDALPPGAVNADALAKAREAAPSMSMDILMAPDTLLPRRYVLDMGFNVNGSCSSMLMTMEFDEYNTDVDIPTVPPNATDFPLPSPQLTPVWATMPWVSTPNVSASPSPTCPAPAIPTIAPSGTPIEIAVPTAR